MYTISGAIMFVALKSGQAVQMGGGDKDHVAAASPIATIGAALPHELLAAKTNHSISTVAAANVDFCFVVKHINLTLLYN